MSGNKENNVRKQKKSFVVSTLITLIIVTMLIFSGPLAEAVSVVISVTSSSTVQAGTANVNFSVKLNITDPDAYIPMSQVQLILSGPMARTFVLDLNGTVISGNTFTNELNTSVSGNYFNYSSGSGYAYSSYYNDFANFGYGFGYGSNYTGTQSRTFDMSLNTTNLYDGNYTAKIIVYTDRQPGGTPGTSPAFQSGTTSFNITPRVYTITIPAISGNGSENSSLIITPVGNFSYTIVAGYNITIPVTMNVTVQVNPPTNVSMQVNSTATGGLGAGAMPNLYLNYSVNESDWYDNISYIHMKMYYNQSSIPSNVVESTLRPARYLSNTTPASWVKLECGTCPRTLEVAKDGKDVILKASGVDTENDYVWANITHFSTFAIAGTVTSSGCTSGCGGSSGGGGGGGGGGGASSENFSNILLKERSDAYVFKDKVAAFFFKLADPIVYVNITGNFNSGEVTTTVEVLKNTSTLVKNISAPGTVYKNINIWAGASGFNSPKNIKEGLIVFKILNSWMSDNKVNGKDVIMVKWNGSAWISLETKEVSKNETHTYFEAKSDLFSTPFAITTTSGTTPEVTEPTPVLTPKETPKATATTPEKKTPGFEAIIAVFAILMLAVSLNKNRNRR